MSLLMLYPLIGALKHVHQSLICRALSLSIRYDEGSGDLGTPCQSALLVAFLRRPLLTRWLQEFLERDPLQRKVFSLWLLLSPIIENIFINQIVLLRRRNLSQWIVLTQLIVLNPLLLKVDDLVVDIRDLLGEDGLVALIRELSGNEVSLVLLENRILVRTLGSNQWLLLLSAWSLQWIESRLRFTNLFHNRSWINRVRLRSSN